MEPYVTRAPHWRYPAGMSVLAKRVSYDCVLLQYQDGTVVEVHGAWYLEGLEAPRVYRYEDSFYGHIFASLDEAMKREMDREILNDFALAG